MKLLARADQPPLALFHQQATKTTPPCPTPATHSSSHHKERALCPLRHDTYPPLPTAFDGSTRRQDLALSPSAPPRVVTPITTTAALLIPPSVGLAVEEISSLCPPAPMNNNLCSLH